MPGRARCTCTPTTCMLHLPPTRWRKICKTIPVRLALCNGVDTDEERRFDHNNLYVSFETRTSRAAAEGGAATAVHSSIETRTSRAAAEGGAATAVHSSSETRPRAAEREAAVAVRGLSNTQSSRAAGAAAGARSAMAVRSVSVAEWMLDLATRFKGMWAFSEFGNKATDYFEKLSACVRPTHATHPSRVLGTPWPPTLPVRWAHPCHPPFLCGREGTITERTERRVRKFKLSHRAIQHFSAWLQTSSSFICAAAPCNTITSRRTGCCTGHTQSVPGKLSFSHSIAQALLDLHAHSSLPEMTTKRFCLKSSSWPSSRSAPTYARSTAHCETPVAR
jgi:hypothetical protein